VCRLSSLAESLLFALGFRVDYFFTASLPLAILLFDYGVYVDPHGMKPHDVAALVRRG
jgi:hypothetical protein